MEQRQDEQDDVGGENGRRILQGHEHVDVREKCRVREHRPLRTAARSRREQQHRQPIRRQCLIGCQQWL